MVETAALRKFIVVQRYEWWNKKDASKHFCSFLSHHKNLRFFFIYFGSSINIRSTYNKYTKSISKTKFKGNIIKINGKKDLEQSSKRIYINFKYVCLTRCIEGNNNKNCRLQYPFHESFRIERDVSYKSQNIMHKTLFCQGQRQHFKKFFAEWPV